MPSFNLPNICQRVTDRIVASLETGCIPWKRPWRDCADPLPLNAASSRPYRGVNFISLQLQAHACGYHVNRWLTYRQATDAGGQVRKGETGVPVVYWRLRRVDARAETQPWPEENDINSRVVPLLRAYTVFNVAQIDGLPAAISEPEATPTNWSPEEAVERMLDDTDADLRHGGNRAFYNLADDFIQLPERYAFGSSADYYATALHELVHWTAHPSRLCRNLRGRFGDASYAMEELVAELGSAFLCAALRLEGDLQHDSYVGHWLRVLRSDKRAILIASAKAQNAADYLAAFTAQAQESVAALAA